MSIPAGWYDDGSGAQRWWDGTGWTEHVAPATDQQQVSPQPAGAAPYSAAPPTNGLAVAALVLGILGFGVVPVILGHIALGQIKQRPPQGGRGMAIAGLVLGYVAIAVGALVIGIILLGAFFAAMTAPGYYR